MKNRLIIVGVVLLICLMAGCSYNSMVAKQEVVKAKWGGVQADYQRRADLVPNLVKVVQGAANFEKSTLIAVTEARAKATAITVDPTKLNAESIQKFQAAQGQLSTALGRLLVAAERYPDLKATENFVDLQKQLEGTENRINNSRRDFNDAVKDYNVSIRTFPAVLVARLFGFNEEVGFAADESAQKAPDVNM